MKSIWQNGKVLLAGTSLFIWLLVFVLFASIGYKETYQLWGVHPGDQIFFDFRLIPGTMDTLRMGLDPTVENPGDPDGRIFNYPRIWYLFALTQISQEDTVWISVLMIAAFFVSAFLFPGKIDRLGAIFMLLVLFSPAAMLLYERANVDLAIFALCALAVIFSEGATTPMAAGILFLASLLKLFPYFGMLTFVSKGKKSFFLWLLLTGIPFAVYIFLTTPNVQASFQETMRGRDISYGSNVIVMYFSHFINSTLKQWFDRQEVPIVFTVLAYLPAVLIVILFLWLGIRQREVLPAASMRNLNAFWMGSAIYIGTFLLGNNWDYRLAFLLFLMPQLSEWIRVTSARDRSVATFTLVLVLLSCWYLFYNRHPYDTDYPLLFIVDELANWSLFASLTYLLARSLPAWVSSLAARPLSLFEPETA